MPNDIVSYTLTGASEQSYSSDELNISAQEIRNIYTEFYDKVANSITTVLKMCNSQILRDIQKMGVQVSIMILTAQNQ